MKVSYENENRVIIAVFIGIFIALTHILLGFGSFVPPPGDNIYAVTLAWILAGLGLIWMAVFSRRISHVKDS
jgi:hypothetical protein